MHAFCTGKQDGFCTCPRVTIYIQKTLHHRKHELLTAKVRDLFPLLQTACFRFIFFQIVLDHCTVVVLQQKSQLVPVYISTEYQQTHITTPNRAESLERMEKYMLKDNIPNAISINYSFYHNIASQSKLSHHTPMLTTLQRRESTILVIHLQ